ncbi:MAG TPA: nucleotidyl transferase AbiEii/AbiGii toxin family protein [Pseudonocardiaceae bacterium]|nr:nucleotidyl transferase AbiEii/AbiGii toxin family protein [Pseudonocardiaceae bacterium]
MSLDPLQERIARTALALPQARTLALAGGGAMIAHGFVTRPTRDIDLFTEVDDQEARQVVVALRRALEEQGLVTPPDRTTTF